LKLGFESPPPPKPPICLIICKKVKGISYCWWYIHTVSKTEFCVHCLLSHATISVYTTLELLSTAYEYTGLHTHVSPISSSVMSEKSRLLYGRIFNSFLLFFNYAKTSNSKHHTQCHIRDSILCLACYVMASRMVWSK
jgi:hypothetical protein